MIGPASAVDGPSPGLGDAALPDVVHRTVARMVLGIEEHPVTRLDRRIHAAGQDQLELRYHLDGEVASFTVDTAHASVIVGPAGGPVSKLLPGPLANDLLVVLGEEINLRTKHRRLDVDSDADRTVRIGVSECLARMKRGTSPQSYMALIETARRLALLRIIARGGAWRSRKGRVRSEVVFGLVDRLEILDRANSAAGARLSFTLSKEFASRLSEDFRPLETGTYWRIDSDPARRLYRLLDNAWHLVAKRRGDAPPTLRIPVHHLRDRLPIDETKLFQIQRKLDRYHAALVAAGFLAEMPTYEPTMADDMRAFPAFPGKTAKLLSAVYRVVPPLAPRLRVDAPASAGAEVFPRESEPTPPPRARASSDLADRMNDLMRDLPDASRHIGLCKLAAEALADDDAWRRCVALARQEAAGIPPVTKLVIEVRGEITRRGLPMPPGLTSREAQRALLLDVGT